LTYIFLLMLLPPPSYTLFPYTTLFRSSPYSASKIGADQMAYSHYCAFGTPVSIARPFNTYGPRQSLRAVIPTMILQALEGKGERSEEHTSELQSPCNLVCRLLLEKKNK